MYRNAPSRLRLFELGDSHSCLIRNQGIEPVLIDFGLSHVLVRVKDSSNPKGYLIRFLRDPISNEPFVDAKTWSWVYNLSFNGEKLFEMMMRSGSWMKEKGLSELIVTKWEPETRAFLNGGFALTHTHHPIFKNFPKDCGGCQCYIMSNHFKTNVVKYLREQGILFDFDVKDEPV